MPCLPSLNFDIFSDSLSFNTVNNLLNIGASYNYSLCNLEMSRLFSVIVF